MKQKSFFAVFCALALCLCAPVSGCAGAKRSAREYLDAALALCHACPVGRVYDGEAASWEEEALPQSIADILYQSGDGESAFSLSEEYALFLASGRLGGEAAVFKVPDPAARLRVLRIASARLARLRRLLPEYDAGVVFERGDAVILLFLPKSEQIRRAL